MLFLHKHLGLLLVINNNLTINFGWLHRASLTTDTTISWRCPRAYNTHGICFVYGDRISNVGWQNVKYRLNSLSKTGVDIEIFLNGASGVTFILYIISIGY